MIDTAVKGPVEEDTDPLLKKLEWPWAFFLFAALFIFYFHVSLRGIEEHIEALYMFRRKLTANKCCCCSHSWGHREKSQHNFILW